MVKEETLEGGPKGGGKEELGEEEWVSLNTLSLRKTKIWQDYSTSLEFKRGEERGGGFVCLGMKNSWQRIMNLDLILAWGKSGALNGKICGSEEQAKFGFLVTAVTACKGNFKK